MTNKTTETTMVTSQQQQLVEPSEPPKKPIFPFFPNFNFNFQIPQFPFPPKHHRHDDGGDDKNKETPKLQSEGGQHGPNVVTFPKSQQVVVVPSPVQTESDAQTPTLKTTNPLLIYQLDGVMVKFERKTPNTRMIYAVGAYFLGRWIWARWNETKGRGGSPDGEDRGAQNNE